MPVVEALTEANYYALLSDGSTDKGVVEEEVIYVLFLKKNGRAAVQFLSIENPKSVDAEGIIDCINSAFERIGITAFRKRLYAVNLDGASVWVDVLSPIHGLNLTEQKEGHGPVKAVKRIKDFSSTMSKLQNLISSAMVAMNTIKLTLRITIRFCHRLQ